MLLVCTARKPAAYCIVNVPVRRSNYGLGPVDDPVGLLVLGQSSVIDGPGPMKSVLFMGY